MIGPPETHVGDPQVFCLVAGLSDPGSGVLKKNLYLMDGDPNQAKN